MRSSSRAQGRRSSPVIHIFEPGGRSGVYQHSVAVAQDLAGAGRRVVLHTAADHELSHLPIEFCPCFDWHRDVRLGRSVRVAADFLIRVLPHLVRQASQLIWIQGGFKLPLTLLLIGILRLVRRQVLFSPHNLFVRRGGRLEQSLLDLCLKLASTVVVYNRKDEEELRGRGLAVRRTNLSLYAPQIPDGVMENWRRVIRENGIDVCSVGQLRDDKNLVMLVDACDKAGLGLLIAGPDLGAADGIHNRIHELANTRTILRVGYLELEDLAAIVSVTGLVALPYSVASQSAVAELALAYGSLVVAYDTGGLSEQAQYLVPDLEVETWSDALSGLAPDAHGLNIQSPLPRVSIASLTAIVDGEIR